MVYLEKITIEGNTFPGSLVLKKGLEIELSSINIFVGEQGCGKSTMLQLLQKNHSDIKLQLSDYTLKNGVNSLYFDTEKDNPRVKDPNMFTKTNGQNIGIGYGGALASRFQSHGEILREFILRPLNSVKDSVILLDEPESGLSITNQYKLIDGIIQAVKNNNQIFIATHCYPLIQEFDVFSLQHNQKMSGKEFIEKVRFS